MRHSLMLFGFVTLIGSAAMAASSEANANALSAAAARAQDDFTIANAEFQTGVRERIIVENDLRMEEPKDETATEETLLVSASK